jgi:hypothetical protein
MKTNALIPDPRHAALAAGRSVRSGGRLASTMVAATTLAAVLAALMQASTGQAIGRSVRGDAVAAVALAMAREMMAVRPTDAAAASPIVAIDAAAGRIARTPDPADLASERRRLGPHRLDLPPPAA